MQNSKLYPERTKDWPLGPVLASSLAAQNVTFAYMRAEQLQAPDPARSPRRYQNGIQRRLRKRDKLIFLSACFR